MTYSSKVYLYNKSHCLPSSNMTYILNYEKFTSPYIHISHIVCRVVLCFILSLKLIESLSVYLSFCASVCFFGLIDFKIGRQLQFGPLKIKQSFCPKLSLSPKGNFLGILITPEPFDGFSSKFQITCLY